MDKDMENLEARVTEERMEREKSVLAMLFDVSREEDAPEDPKMARNYEGLYQTMAGSSPELQERILGWVTLIHRDAERDGFDRGLKLGHRLREELG